MIDLRAKIILNILKNEKFPIKSEELAKRMGLSSRTLRGILQSIPQKNTAFCVKLSRGIGYELHIADERAFHSYMDSLPIYYSPSQRMDVLLFYLLQEEGYTTISGLEEKLLLSRSTIVKELKSAEKVLSRYDLALERKARLGIKVTGKEEDVRRAFSQYVLGSVWYLEPASEYRKIMDVLNVDALKKALREGLAQNNLVISSITFDNIIIHLKILAYRASKRNFIHSTKFGDETQEQFKALAKHLVNWIGREYEMSLPPSEEEFLATHISTKASIMEMEEKEKGELYSNIDIMLEQLDHEFLTDFCGDKDLREALLLHLLPILNHRYQNFKLTNPLVEEAYTKYANIFMVGLRFARLIEDAYGFSASRDEIGYLTLHFATHFERLKQKLFRNVKRIVVICSTGGGSAHLLRLKLEEIFSRSTIITTAQSDLSEFARDLPDIFLSMISLGDEYAGIPIVHIKEFLNDEELHKIRDAVFMRLSGTGSLNLLECFQEQFFQKITGSYPDIIREQSQLMVEAGFASLDFTRLVLEREERFTTIYANGVAGPHSMKLNARKNSIGVTILKNKTRHKGKSVQIIFLINLMPGHLFLHKEISRLMLYLIDNEAAKKKLINAKDYNQFKRELSKII